MGSVTFNDSYYVSGIGESEQNVRINYSETYDSSTNKTTVKLTSVEFACSRYLGNCPFRGKVYFGSTVVKNYPTSTSSYTVTIGSGGATSYATVTGNGGDSITVTHNTNGTASFTVKLVATEGSYFGAAYSGKMFGISNNSSKTVNLTKRTSTLTVNPNGGTWSSSTVAQTFS